MKVFTLFVAGVLLVVAGGCGGGSSETVAEVNGQEITEKAYLKQLETMDRVTIVLENGQRVTGRPSEPLSAQALNRLIEQSILLQTAADEKTLPTKDEIEKERRSQVGRNPEFLNQMKMLGYTVEDVDRALQLQLAQYKLSVRGMPEKTIADAEQYVKQNPEEFKRPPQAAFRWIVVRTEAKKQEVDKALGGGLTFGTAAGRYSIVDNAQADNGAYPPGQGPAPSPVPMTALNPAMLKALQTTPQGKMSDWFKSGDNFVKILVESKIPAQAYTPTAAELEILRRALTVQETRGTNNISKLLVEKLLDAKIKVYPQYLKRNWETLMTNLRQRMDRLEGEAGAGGSTAPKAGG